MPWNRKTQLIHELGLYLWPEKKLSENISKVESLELQIKTITDNYRTDAEIVVSGDRLPRDPRKELEIEEK